MDPCSVNILFHDIWTNQYKLINTYGTSTTLAADSLLSYTKITTFLPWELSFSTSQTVEQSAGMGNSIMKPTFGTKLFGQLGKKVP